MTCTDKATEIKLGDRFEITVEVAEASASPTKVHTVSVGEGRWNFELHERYLLAGRRVARPLGIGERVKRRDNHIRIGTIVAIHGDQAWIEDTETGNGMFTWSVSMIERAPAPDTKEGTS